MKPPGDAANSEPAMIFGAELRDQPAFERDWAVAIEYYPTARDFEAKLRTVDLDLATSFRKRLVQEKRFARAEEIAREMEREFRAARDLTLRTRFGEDPKILEFARRLLAEEMTAYAEMLADAVRVLGDAGNPETVIQTIERKIETAKAQAAIAEYERLECFWLQLRRSQEARDVSADEYKRACAAVGAGLQHKKNPISHTPDVFVTFHGKSLSFPSERRALEWLASYFPRPTPASHATCPGCRRFVPKGSRECRFCGRRLEPT